MIVFRSPTPGPSPAHSFETAEREETDRPPANHPELESDWVKALEDAVRVSLSTRAVESLELTEQFKGRRSRCGIRPCRY